MSPFADHSPQIHVGCTDLPAGMSWSSYFQKLSFVELEAFYRDQPQLRAVRAWRKKSGNLAEFSLVAPRELAGPTGLVSKGEKQTVLDHFAAACSEIRAAAVVFRTDASFTPSQTNRDAVRRFFGEVATPERFPSVRVWEPTGLWPQDAVLALATELEFLTPVDPLAPDPLLDSGIPLHEHLMRDFLYVRATGLGHRGRFRDHELSDLVAMIRQAPSVQRAWVTFAHPERYRDALATHALVSACTSS